MKIWIIGRNYPTAKNKMCGSFEYGQAQMLSRQGHEVCYIVCPFHPLYKVRKWGAVDWKEDDIHVYAYSQLYFPQRFNIYCNWFKEPIWRSLLAYVESKQEIPDVIHLHYPTMISVPEPILEFKKKGTKIIATEHWSKVLTGKLTMHAKKQLKQYVENVDHFICVGHPLKDSVIQITGTNKEIHVIPNAVPILFDRNNKSHDGFKFLAVGRLVKEKRFEKIISAFSSAFSECKDVSLTIIGGGSQFRTLQKQIKKNGIEKQIQLLGTKSREEVAEYMSNSDALVSYSKYETFGVPVVEAWYCGIPAIAANTIGIADYWNDSLGELVPFNNVEQLISAMQRVKDNYKKYSKEAISSYAREHFSEAEIYKKIINLYYN